MKRQTESGEVAMLMVGIFTAVFSILTIGLSYVMVNTVRNSKNDTLSYNARAAAESGIEDAKRFLKYCYVNDFGHIDDTREAYKICDVMYATDKTADIAKTQDCNGVINKMKDIKAKDGKSFDVDFENDGDNVLVPVGKRYNSSHSESKLDKNKENLQYYQCLKINTLTRSYEGVLSDMTTGSGRSVVIPLRLVDDNRHHAKAKTIVISWHNTGDKPEGDGKAAATPDEVTLWNTKDWAKVGHDEIRPAILRAQFIPVKKSGIKIDDLTNDSRAITMRPTSSKNDIGDAAKNYGGKTVDESIKVVEPTIEKDDGLVNVHPLYIEDYKMSLDPNSSTRVPIAGAVCPDSKGKTNGEYACSTAFQFSRSAGALFDTDMSKRDWFLRVNSVYSNTHFRVTAYDEHDKPLWFDGVQPSVDVTGKSAESYARIHARLEPVNQDETGLGNWWPEYAIDTSGSICKDLVIKYNKGEIGCKASK